MKSSYRYNPYNWKAGYYYWPVSGGYCRRMRTFQQIRDIDYLKNEEIEIKIRSCRGNSYLNAWSLEKVFSRCGSKSWKDFTKRHHQWKDV